MSTTYRCKVRKPDGAIVDGCGYEFTPRDPEHFTRDGMGCPECKAGSLRPLTATVQIHGGPLVADVLKGLHDRLGQPELGKGRHSDQAG